MGAWTIGISHPSISVTRLRNSGRSVNRSLPDATF
jgi:hypothetical protein